MAYRNHQVGDFFITNAPLLSEGAQESNVQRFVSWQFHCVLQPSETETSVFALIGCVRVWRCVPALTCTHRSCRGASPCVHACVCARVCACTFATVYVRVGVVT